MDTLEPGTSDCDCGLTSGACTSIVHKWPGLAVLPQSLVQR